MKKVSYKLSLFLLFVCMNFCFVFAQQSEVDWDYPIKPGSMEWKKLKNSYKKIKACQIPDEILSNLSILGVYK